MVRLMSNSCERSWAIIRLLPNAQTYIVTRFYNRQDAEDHKRVLQRFIPAAEFKAIFINPDEEPNN